MNFDEHTSGQFNNDLENLRTQLMEMGGLVERQVEEAISCVCSGEGVDVQEYARREDEVDQFELNIENNCTNILARRQPAASDLRMVLAVSRISRDLERMGDLAFKILSQANELKAINMEKFQAAIFAMGREVHEMIVSVLNAFIRNDPSLALDVIEQDEYVDRRYEGALRELITYMMEDPRSIGQSINVLWVIRSLERIGDHAENISEQVIYLVSGEDVRHSSLSEKQEAADNSNG